MLVLYGIAVLGGSVALIGWVMWDALAAAPSSTRPSATERFGAGGRRVVMAGLGFGLGGLSAAFAGWNPLLAAFAAIVGAVALAYAAQILADHQV